ncbi:Maltose phosphorylase / Trehalose phosphorylase [hydrothermal vent metagenome]|uniref:Maltose phosphorylase / Trehalose phosphorylase n=1 Tax=hydrothermal vent metagenome TaxID=652676 RepID=A0A3B1DLQ2_9ZZZZ
MKIQNIKLPSENIYPVDEWRIVQKQYAYQFLAQDETIFSTANGYLGMRGNFEERTPVYKNGTFINGFYESWPLHYEEDAFGFAKTGQAMLNVADSKVIRLFVDDEFFDIAKVEIMEFERVLNMRRGVLERKVLWKTSKRKEVLVKSQRIVSFDHRHLAMIHYEVTVINDKADVIISSEIICEKNNHVHEEDPRKGNNFRHDIFIPISNYISNSRIVLCHKTTNSNMFIAYGIDHVLKTECSFFTKMNCDENKGHCSFYIQADPGKSVCLTKFMAYHSSKKDKNQELCQLSESTLKQAVNEGVKKILKDQKSYMKNFWQNADILIEGESTRMQQCIRFNLFHILQSCACIEDTSIGAKGLTGEAYGGHYFWDCEIYIFPFLIYTYPNIARNILRFRYSTLDKARERAAQVNQKGALYPWRTINGEESSAYFAASTAQYHINADIMYALKKYVEITGDNNFLYKYGVEMLIETARLWVDIGFYEKNGKFHIHQVTGPDEYTALVNNNTYTNLMARENLLYAVYAVKLFCEYNKKQYKNLTEKVDFSELEIESWKKAAKNMHIPYDKKLGIHPQDDDFLKMKPWDFENTPTDKYPLLLHYHPLFLYRHKVIKQADIVLALFLLGDKFSTEEKKKNFKYYDPITTGDSSLSACIQGIIAAEIGDYELTMKYMRYAALMDLANVGGNVKDGVHVASMGGTWMVIVYGIAGMRDYNGRISFDPRMSEYTKHLKFTLLIRKQLLEIDIQLNSVTYTLLKGSKLTIYHQNEEIRLLTDQPRIKDLKCVNRLDRDCECKMKSKSHEEGVVRNDASL